MDKCPRYLKQWVLRCLPKKEEKEINKIAHIFFAKLFPSSKSEIYFQGAK
jgi:hypothetical protein